MRRGEAGLHRLRALIGELIQLLDQRSDMVGGPRPVLSNLLKLLLLLSRLLLSLPLVGLDTSGPYLCQGQLLLARSILALLSRVVLLLLLTFLQLEVIQILLL